MANTALPPDACLVKSWIWFTVEPVSTVTDCLALAETPAPLAHLRLRPAGPLPSGSDCTLMELLDSLMLSACKREPTMAPKAKPPRTVITTRPKSSPTVSGARNRFMLFSCCGLCWLGTPKPRLARQRGEVPPSPSASPPPCHQPNSLRNVHGRTIHRFLAPRNTSQRKTEIYLHRGVVSLRRLVAFVGSHREDQPPLHMT